LLQWSGYGRTSMWTHLQHYESIANVMQETKLPCDFEKEYLTGEQAFKVSIRSRKTWRDERYPAMDPSEMVCRTDESKGEGSVAAAFIIETDNSMIPLENYTSVYQAEM